MLLINDVPLLQSKDDLLRHMKKSMDTDVDFVLMVLPAIGTPGQYNNYFDVSNLFYCCDSYSQMAPIPGLLDVKTWD